MTRNIDSGRPPATSRLLLAIGLAGLSVMASAENADAFRVSARIADIPDVPAMSAMANRCANGRDAAVRLWNETWAKDKEMLQKAKDVPEQELQADMMVLMNEKPQEFAKIMQSVQEDLEAQARLRKEVDPLLMTYIDRIKKFKASIDREPGVLDCGNVVPCSAKERACVRDHLAKRRKILDTEGKAAMDAGAAYRSEATRQLKTLATRAESGHNSLPQKNGYVRTWFVGKMLGIGQLGHDTASNVQRLCDSVGYEQWKYEDHIKGLKKCGG